MEKKTLLNQCDKLLKEWLSYLMGNFIIAFIRLSYSTINRLVNLL